MSFSGLWRGEAHAPARFQSFWLGPELPKLQRLCLSSFIHHGHEFDLYAYDQIEAPAGVSLRDATEILGRDRVFYYKSEPGLGSVAGFSNLFRYKLLHERGGWWVDADVLCQTDIVPQQDIFFCRESDTTIGNAVMKFPKGCDLLLRLVRECETLGIDIKWGQTGPRLLTAAIEGTEYEIHERPQSVSYPIHFREYAKFLAAAAAVEVREKTREAPFVHLWNEMFRRNPKHDSTFPEPGSFLDEAYKLYSTTRQERRP